jgi:hypothetical protein
VPQRDGDIGAVRSVALEQRSQPMYNLTVAVAHTFFVGDEQWLVHNANKCNWGNPKSYPTYGHTFSDHGQKVKLAQLIDRARGLNHQNGQFLNDNDAARILGDLVQSHQLQPGVHDLPIPADLKTRVVLPDGTEIKADSLRIIIKQDGTIRTSFPMNSTFPN